MLRILLIRHGQTDWNLEGRSQGREDVDLNDVGREQAAKLALALTGERVDALFVSDMHRTRNTALPIAAALEIEVREDARLRERDYGSWEGKTHDEIIKADAEGRIAYEADPVIAAGGGGETGIDVFMRVTYFLTELLSMHRSGTVMLVTHGGAGSAVLAALLNGTPSTADAFRLLNCGVTEVHIGDQGRRKLVRYNDVSHLCE